MIPHLRPSTATSNHISDLMAEMDHWKTPESAVLRRLNTSAEEIRRLTKHMRPPAFADDVSWETRLEPGSTDAERQAAAFAYLKREKRCSADELARAMSWTRHRAGRVMRKLVAAGHPVEVLKHPHNGRVEYRLGRFTRQASGPRREA